MATAQDVIVKTDNSTILSKVLEINSTEIKYKKWSNQEGPTYSISISEVASINYQNGEVDNFSILNNQSQPDIQNTETGIMEKYNSFFGSSGLSLNGRKLSNEEVQSLVDEQNYQLYTKGKLYNIIASPFSTVGALLMGGGLGQWLFNYKHKTPEERKIGAGIALGGLVLCIPGIVIGTIGDKKLKQVAVNYNQTHSKPYALKISPSIMTCGTPQSQGNCGLGLTVSMNF